MARNDMEIDIYSDFGRVAHVQSERFILFSMYGVGGGNQIPIIAWCLLCLNSICFDSLGSDIMRFDKCLSF